MASPVTGATNVFSSLGDWLAQPFNPQMDTTHWFLFGGLIVVVLGIWLLILRDLKGAIE